MTKREKRLQKMRNNPKAVRFNDLLSVLDDYEFNVGDARGSHYVVSHPDYSAIEAFSIVRPHGKRKQVAAVYVKKVLAAIDAVIELREADGEDNRE